MPIPESSKVTFERHENYMVCDVTYRNLSNVEVFGGECFSGSNYPKLHLGTLTADQAFTFYPVGRRLR
jgi:hypothetical protein